MQGYFLGIDIGTTNVKAAVYDAGFSRVAEGSAEYPTFIPRPGWAEQDPDQWWAAATAAVHRCIDGGGVSASDIRGLCISSHAPAVVPLGDDGRPVRNGLIWMDRRSEPQCAEIRQRLGETRVGAITGNRIDPYFAAAKLLWFKENEEELYGKTRHVLQANGYVNFRLTGVSSVDRVHATLTGLYDTTAHGWSAELCAALGISTDLLPMIHSPSDVIGTVTAAAAVATGLREGTPVVAGNVDASAAAIESGVLGSGEAVEATGTSTVLMIGCDSFPKSLNLVAMGHAPGDRALLIGPVSSTGAALKWYRDQLGLDERVRAAERGTDPYKVMDEEAEAPGGGELIFLPYLAGERSPIWDTDARGVFFGLGIKTDRGRIVRSIMEGSAFALRHNLEEAIRSGPPVRELRAVGGGAESRLWLKIKASVLRMPVVTLKNASSGVLGNAALAAYGVGALSDIEGAMRDRLVFGERIEPDSGLAKRYEKLYRIYRNVYEHTKADFKDLSES